MRVTSDLWVSALLRRVFSDGGFASVIRRGAPEAGAVFVIARDRFGDVTLFGPAPQTEYDSGRPDDRRFSELGTGLTEVAVDARLAKESKFDSDIWVIELEPAKTPLQELLGIMKP